MNSERWGETAEGTSQAIREVRSHPIAGPLLDSAIAIEALALGAVGGSIAMELAPYAGMAMSYTPQAMDFISSAIPTGTPAPSLSGYVGGAAGYMKDILTGEK